MIISWFFLPSFCVLVLKEEFWERIPIIIPKSPKVLVYTPIPIV